MTAQAQAQTHTLRVPVSDSDWSRGPADAPVTLVEYGDYECKDCRAAYPVVEKLLAANPERIRMVFRHFPFESLHPHAMQAALAAEAAGRQGKFWEMHARLYESEGKLDAEDLERCAREMGLDIERFRSDVEDPQAAKEIRHGKLQAVRSGAGRTPTFFLNGARYDGPANLDSLQAAVNHLA